MTRPNKLRHRAGNGLSREFRLYSTDNLEVRDGGSALPDTIVLSGQPIMYEAPYLVRDSLGEFEETMKPGVVKDIIDTCDCRFLVNHAGMPLARTLSGTLTLNDSAESLGFNANLDARSSQANDLAVAVDRGDISQMSVGFIVANDVWSPDYSQRSILTFRDLVDVSAVTYPASPTTTIGVDIMQRMIEQIEEQEIPWSDQVRMRKLWNLGVDLRAGKVISKANADHLANMLDAVKNASDALSSAHDHLQAVAAAGGVKPAGATTLTTTTDDTDPNAKPTGTVGGEDGSTSAPKPAAGLGNEDNSGSRSVRGWSGKSLLEGRAAKPPVSTGTPEHGGTPPGGAKPPPGKYVPPKVSTGTPEHGGTPPKGTKPPPGKDVPTAAEKEAAAKKAAIVAADKKAAAAAQKFSHGVAMQAHAEVAKNLTAIAANHADDPQTQNADLAAAGAHQAASGAHMAAATATDAEKGAAQVDAKAATKVAGAATSGALKGWAAYDAAKKKGK